MSLGGTGMDDGHGITSVGLDKIAVPGRFYSSTATFGDIVLTKKGDWQAFIAMVSVCTLLFAIH